MNWTVLGQTTGLLILSNVFMTMAWYAHLKDLRDKPWIVAALISWGIALFEYLLQVPANRIGYTALSLPQLKILQEVITLAVFVPFVLFYMKQPLKWDYLWAALCMVGAVYFIFRSLAPRLRESWRVFRRRRAVAAAGRGRPSAHSCPARKSRGRR